MRIIESLANNKTIKVFDYSFNKLGESTPSCSKAICNFLNNNKTVTHCDFSCNNFNIDESKLIG